MFHANQFDAEAVQAAGADAVIEAGTDALVTKRSTVDPGAAQQNPEYALPAVGTIKTFPTW